MVIFPLREGGARAITGARAGARAISETRPDLGPGPNFYKDFILCLEKCSTHNIFYQTLFQPFFTLLLKSKVAK